MAKRLYVGGLPYSTTDQQLAEAFADCGTVTLATIIMDKMTGRSKGFGFVEMSTDDEADAAIQKKNGADLAGRKLTVNEARPRTERPQDNDRGGRNW
jgi:cold-inducible RNA-binding protein